MSQKIKNIRTNRYKFYICPECNGDGEIEVGMSDYVSGTMECPRCSGEKVIHTDHLIPVRNQIIWASLTAVGVYLMASVIGFMSFSVVSATIMTAILLLSTFLIFFRNGWFSHQIKAYLILRKSGKEEFLREKAEILAELAEKKLAKPLAEASQIKFGYGDNRKTAREQDLVNEMHWLKKK